MDVTALAAGTSLSPARRGLRGRLLNLVLRRFFKRRLVHIEFSDAAIADMRRRMEVIAAREASKWDDLQISRTTLANVPVEALAPANLDAAAPVVLYFHGGAFVAGSPLTHRSITARLARELGARVLVADYRLAPEHRYPAALDDVLAVYRHVLRDTAATRIALAGDSAGGNLVLSTLLRARDEALDLPAAGVALSPWSDLTGSGQSVVTNADRDAMLPGHKIELAARLYAPEADLTEPWLSPVFGDYTGLPPLLLHAGTTEILYDDATRVVQAARAAGVAAQLRLWRDLPHVFHLFSRHLPAARLAMNEIVEFLRDALRAPERS